ncbi:MAG: acid phosphatase type 7 [Acidobacteriota bacterium]|jgi:hypothetical protein|nr:acid phosphatase type 7 [Acidobacteriota bacterium]
MNRTVFGLWKDLSCCTLIFAAGCSSSTPGVMTPLGAGPKLTVEEVLSRKLADDDALLIGAGDIVRCGRSSQPARDTAAVIKKFPSARVVTLGDNVYRNGTKAEFDDCYEPTWGGFKDRTWPSPGNHDYGPYSVHPRHNADPYFEYFGTNAGDKGKGFYSHDLGSWHIVSLNSMADQRGAPSMNDQLQWLKNDLAHNQQPCILAFWHHPLFSSGDEHGDQDNDPGRSMGPLWAVLLDHDADVILNGHDHHYERFALQDSQIPPQPTPDGIRELIIGTGGGEERGLGIIKDNSEVQLPHVFGVVLMTLHRDSYDWDFIRADGRVVDSSSFSSGPTACH